MGLLYHIRGLLLAGRSMRLHVSVEAQLQNGFHSFCAGRVMGTVISEVIEMLRWAVIFLVVALVAAILGFGGIAGVAATIAKWIFWLFVILFVIALISGYSRPRTI